MRISALLAILALCGGVIACGDARRNLSSSLRTTSAGSYLKSDGDKDADEHQKGPSKEDLGEMKTPAYGSSNADREAITTIVESYFAAAVGGDATKGCSLLAAGLATAVTEEQSQITGGGVKTCAASLSRLFAQQHQRLAAEDPSTMVVTGVHVHGSAGLATLGFRKATESELVLRREAGEWKIDALFDSTLP